MEVIYNRWIPFKGFKAINLFGFVFAREGSRIGARLMTHEAIHTSQMKETLFVFFYLWYLVEWVVRVILEVQKGDECTASGIFRRAYRKISFEQEAYDHEYFSKYLGQRKHYNWIKYLRKNGKSN